MAKSVKTAFLTAGLLSTTALHALAEGKPNILLIVADDMGRSDIHAFGGEIATPNLDRLASEGVMMSEFYTSPMSAPARSMLLTGNSNQQAGMGGMWWYENTVGQDGYEERLTKRVTTMPEIFKAAGYETLMSGKWHLGYMEGARPNDNGFNHSFAFMGGGASHYNDVHALGKVEEFHTFYTKDNQRIKSLPADFYSTKAYSDQLQHWIKETPKDKPIFAYLPFTAPHDPLQAPDDWIARYNGVYDKGYYPIYQKRIEKLKKLGLLKGDAPLPQLDLQERWDKLSDEEKRVSAKTMQVYAAMISYMDNEIGHVIKTLEETGRADNTIIIFISDNGASASIARNYDKDPNYWKNTDNSVENIGRIGSFVAVGPDWADVSDAPYAFNHKRTSGQGGINTPFIIHAPKLANKGQLKDAQMAVYDIAPTLYDMAGLDPKLIAAKNEGKIKPIGVSFSDYFENAVAKSPRNGHPIGLELHNQSALIDGEWKLRRLVDAGPTAKMADWELYNIKQDPLETKNLAAEHRDIVADLTKKYDDYAKGGMVIMSEGKLIPYLGVDEKTGKYIGVSDEQIEKSHHWRQE